MADTVPIFRPVRARLAEALACVTDMPVEGWTRSLATLGLVWRTDHVLLMHVQPGLRAYFTVASPQEAWERLVTRGLVPDGWAPHATRFFADDARGPAASEMPATIAQCVALASDMDAVLAVEQLFAARARPPNTVRGWRLLSEEETRGFTATFQRALPRWQGRTDEGVRSALEVMRLGYGLTASSHAGAYADTVVIPTIELEPAYRRLAAWT